jgi:GTP-binding protein HflX
MVSALKSYNIEGILSEISTRLYGKRSRRKLRLKPTEFSSFMRFRGSVNLSENYEKDLIEVEYVSSDEINKKLISSICEEEGNEEIIVGHSGTLISSVLFSATLLFPLKRLQK